MSCVAALVAFWVCVGASYANASPVAYSTPRIYKSTKSGGTPVWSGPSSTSTFKHYLPAGAYVTVTAYESTKTKWLKTYNGTWVWADNLQNMAPDRPGLTTPGQYIVIADHALLRTAPSEASGVFDKRFKNAPLQIKALQYNDRGHVWGETMIGATTYYTHMTGKLQTHFTHLKDVPSEVRNCTSIDGQSHSVAITTHWTCRCGASAGSITSHICQDHDFSSKADLDCNGTGCRFVRDALRAPGVYKTNRDQVPLRKVASSSGTVHDEIAKTGTKVKVGAPFYNAVNNVWAPVVAVNGVAGSGYFVYMGNLQGNPLVSMAFSSPTKRKDTKTGEMVPTVQLVVTPGNRNPQKALADAALLRCIPPNHTDALTWTATGVKGGLKNGLYEAPTKSLDVTVTVAGESGAKARVVVEVLKFRSPLHESNTKFTSRWNKDFSGRIHNGIDLDGNDGVPVRAAERGTVEKIGWQASGTKGFGRYVWIRHPNGLLTMYAHLQKDSVIVGEGKHVDRGAPFATMGDSPGAYPDHLHFCMGTNPYGYDFVNGGNQDPSKFILMPTAAFATVDQGWN